ncbi:hypothetical protein F383_33600 [Gossypium arboreum]|uniref:Uncharacterized protein n=1 Tax=Gossypium arboreum TaxID=29729 RepID=A0A0B0MXR1_GOSAR|nr:hypothetical protein F383_33600 [Gossypium arboreum]
MVYPLSTTLMNQYM